MIEWQFIILNQLNLVSVAVVHTCSKYCTPGEAEYLRECTIYHTK